MVKSFYYEVLNPVLQNIEKFADRNAFCFSSEFYTYKDFGCCISQIAKKVEKAHFSNKLVGLVLNDDIETYSSIFALWMKGCCYVPLHCNWPIDRCLDICEQVGIDLILDSSENTRYQNTQVVNTFNCHLDKCVTDLAFDSNVPENDLAYILFTSGSTGKSKGVQLMRSNVASFMVSFWKTGIKITEEDKCLQAFDLTFDVSVQNYLSALTRGACLYTIPYGKVKYLYAGNLMDEYGLTFASMAPSMLKYLLRYIDELDFSNLKSLILTAEACPIDLMEEWMKAVPTTTVYDFYGPTECTIYCTYYKLSNTGNPNKSCNGIISIGKPLANCKGLILNENGEEVSHGEKGELCIAGGHVCKGYWKNDEKNKEAFFEIEENGLMTRYYHTGDLVVEDKDGDILYLGRIDNQAKIQGFRVELGEIEYHARQYLGGTSAVCIAFDNKEKLTELTLFIEAKEFDTKDLLDYMRSKMPSYMIPSKILFVPVFPLNGNEKVDRKELAKLINK